MFIYNKTCDLVKIYFLFISLVKTLSASKPKIIVEKAKNTNGKLNASKDAFKMWFWKKKFKEIILIGMKMKLRPSSYLKGIVWEAGGRSTDAYVGSKLGIN